MQRGELELSDSAPHRALASFEKALQHFPNHPAAVVGLSSLLLDIYTQKIPAEEVTLQSLSLLPKLPETMTSTLPDNATALIGTAPNGRPSTAASSSPIPPKPRREDLTPEHLNRIAARDRAYGLLSSLTKSGRGWDCAEAWFALARAYEEGEQKEKARSCLWWVVELEEGKGVRGWGCVGGAGGVL